MATGSSPVIANLYRGWHWPITCSKGQECDGSKLGVRELLHRTVQNMSPTHSLGLFKLSAWSNAPWVTAQCLWALDSVSVNQEGELDLTYTAPVREWGPSEEGEAAPGISITHCLITMSLSPTCYSKPGQPHINITVVNHCLSQRFSCQIRLVD